MTNLVSSWTKMYRISKNERTLKWMYYCEWEWIADGLHLCLVYLFIISAILNIPQNRQFHKSVTPLPCWKMEKMRGFFFFFFTCIHLEWDHLWTGFFKKTLQAQVKVQPPLTWCVHTRGWGFKKKQQNKTKKSLTTSSRACFWSGPLIDSHCSCSGSDLLAGNDPHIWTAEYIERSLGND